MGGGVLDVAQRNPGIKGSGDESMTKGVRAYGLGDPGAAGGPADDPRGAVPVQPAAVSSQEDRPGTAFADRQVDRPRRPGRERDDHDLAPFAGDGQRPVPAFHAEGLDVRTNCLGDSQPVEGQQRDQRVLCRRAEPAGDQQRPELVAVQADRVGFVVQARAADMRRR